MRMRKVIDICKKTGALYLYNTEEGVQWISDGAAMYPMFDLPQFGCDELCEVFDLTDEQREKMHMSHLSSLPNGVSVEDIQVGERPVERLTPWMRYAGTDMVAYRTSDGVVFLDARYLTPYEKAESLDIYERHTASGQMYFAVKIGFMLHGLIEPQKPDRALLSGLEDIVRGYRTALEIAERESGDEPEQLQLNTEE